MNFKSILTEHSANILKLTKKVSSWYCICSRRNINARVLRKRANVWKGYQDTIRIKCVCTDRCWVGDTFLWNAPNKMGSEMAHQRCQKDCKCEKKSYVIFFNTNGLAIRSLFPEDSQWMQSFIGGQNLEIMSNSCRNIDERGIRGMFLLHHSHTSQKAESWLLFRMNTRFMFFGSRHFFPSSTLWCFLLTCLKTKPDGKIFHPIKSWEPPYKTFFKRYTWKKKD